MRTLDQARKDMMIAIDKGNAAIRSSEDIEAINALMTNMLECRVDIDSRVIAQDIAPSGFYKNKNVTTHMNHELVKIIIEHQILNAIREFRTDMEIMATINNNHDFFSNAVKTFLDVSLTEGNLKSIFGDLSSLLEAKH